MNGEFTDLLVPVESFRFRSEKERTYINHNYKVENFWTARLVYPGTVINCCEKDVGFFFAEYDEITIKDIKSFILQLRVKKFKSLKQACEYVNSFLKPRIVDFKPGVRFLYPNYAFVEISLHKNIVNQPLFFRKGGAGWKLPHDIEDTLQIYSFKSKPQAIKYLHSYVSHNLHTLYFDFINAYSISSYHKPLMFSKKKLLNSELDDSWWMNFVKPGINLEQIF